MEGTTPDLMLEEMNGSKSWRSANLGSRNFQGSLLKGCVTVYDSERHSLVRYFIPYISFHLQVETSNGYAHLHLIRGSQAQVKAWQDEDTLKRIEVTEDPLSGRIDDDLKIFILMTTKTPLSHNDPNATTPLTGR